MPASNNSRSPSERPLISFAVACYNSRPYLQNAVASALSQRGVAVEILIVDDGSMDGSLADAESLAASDDRVKVLRTAANSGPASARNLALENMSGEWFAVLDSDDLIDPARSDALLTLAADTEADLVADNLLVFGDGVDEHVMFDVHRGEDWYWLGLEEYFARSQLFVGTRGPGYLKPMIRRSTIERLALRYNEALRVGEDDELIVRSLAAGCRYAVSTRPMYRYREHAGSISHRLSLDHAELMMAAERDMRAKIGPGHAALQSYRKRWKALVRGVAFIRSIQQLKDRRPLDAARTLCRHPGALALYRMPLKARLRRIRGGQ